MLWSQGSFCLLCSCSCWDPLPDCFWEGGKGSGSQWSGRLESAAGRWGGGCPFTTHPWMPLHTTILGCFMAKPALAQKLFGKSCILKLSLCLTRTWECSLTPLCFGPDPLLQAWPGRSIANKMNLYQKSPKHITESQQLIVTCNVG